MYCFLFFHNSLLFTQYPMLPNIKAKKLFYKHG